MKPSFFPQGSDDALRLTLLSETGSLDPMMLIKKDDSSLLFGTGFSTLEKTGRVYPTFPDMRLPYSEKDRITGWIILVPGFDIQSFRVILETLGFPHVYGNRDVIAYIRDNISDTVFLDQCRFFELFSPGTSERKIGEFHLSEKYDTLMLSTLAGNILFTDSVVEDMMCL